MAALGASVVLPFTPGLAQEAPVVTPPPVVATPPAATPAPAPAPAPMAATPAPTPPARPPVSIAPLPPTAPETPPPAAEERPAARAQTPARAARAPARPAAEAPAERAAPTPAPAPAEPFAAEPAPLPEALEPLPEALEPFPAPPELTAPEPIEQAQPAETPAAAPTGLWIAAGVALLLAVLALFAWRRRAREEERVHVTPAPVAPTEPARAPAPAARAPAPPTPAPRPDASARHADPRDLAAMAASSRPEAGRPWLEFLMRPVRAGTDADEAVVEFELTVGNTGTVPARDVRISTWMFAAGDGASEMERSLIEPPAGAKRATATIAPGDGAQVETAIALPKEELRGKVLPVIVADARYRLPDGSEGRTSASFAVGLPNGEGLEPFAVDLPTGLREDVEARLHGEPQRA